ncbi:TldD/PmbA family protein [bacterium]|nr:TldD/PmbA family protein [bacterium]
MFDPTRVDFCIEALERAGAESSQVQLIQRQQDELYLESDSLNLFRTTFDTSLKLVVIHNHRRAVMTTNVLDDRSLAETVEQLMTMTTTSLEDPAYDIAEYQPARDFRDGPSQPDYDLMYNRLHDFQVQVRRRFPRAILRRVSLYYLKEDMLFRNTNRVSFTSHIARYGFYTVFTSKKGRKSSATNYTMLGMKDLDRDILDSGSTDLLLKQSAEQIEPRRFPGKVQGDIIMSPDCLGSFIDFLVEIFLSSQALVSQTSLLKDRLDQKIAADSFSLSSKPVSPELAGKSFLTRDGYVADNCVLIERGILKTFVLDLYAARKTGFERAPSDGDFYVVEPGNSSLDQMVRTIDRGLLLGRFAGNRPSDNGDFAGVAKNSYLIEQGKIAYPVTETMISGNLLAMLEAIVAISTERVHFGQAIFPWIHFSGLTISGWSHVRCL